MDQKSKLLFFLKQPAFIIIAGYLYIISTIQFGFNPYDSGIILTGGMRILNGELPYRDFFTMYAPGQFYLDALIQLLSREVILIRFLLSLFQLGILIQISKISRFLFEDKYHLYSVLMSSLWLGSMELYNRGIIISIFLVLLLIRNIITKENEEQNYYSLGFILSLITFFRHDIGLLSILFFNIYFIFSNKTQISKYLNLLLKLLVGFSPLILFVIYLGIESGFEELYLNLIDIPKNVFPKYRSMSFPNPFESFSLLKLIKNILHSLSFYIPFVTIILFIIKYFKTKSLKNHDIILMIGILIFLNQMFTRSDLEHALPAVLLSSISYFYLLKEIINFKKIILIGILIFLPNIVAKKVKIVKNIMPEFKVSQIEGLKNIYLNIEYDQDLSNTIDYIKNNTNANDKIFVGLDRHDITLINESSFYYLTNRMPSTKYHELHPGVTTIHSNQINIINEIEKNKVKYIISTENPNSDEYIPDDGKILDIYIDKNFKLKRQFGMFRILKKIISQ